MSPIDWATLPFKKFADFSGRAPRAEYWWFFLLLIVLTLVAMIIENIVGLDKMFMMYGPVMLLLIVVTFIPSLSVLVRRLHDTNRSGWWAGAFWVVYGFYMWSMRGVMGAMVAADGTDPGADAAAMSAAMTESSGSLIMGSIAGLLFLILAIVMLVFLCLRGTQGDNRYGPDPYGA